MAQIHFQRTASALQIQLIPRPPSQQHAMDVHAGNHTNGAGALAGVRMNLFRIPHAHGLSWHLILNQIFYLRVFYLLIARILQSSLASM